MSSAATCPADAAARGVEAALLMNPNHRVEIEAMTAGTAMTLVDPVLKT